MVINHESNRFGKQDFLVPIINQLGIYDEKIKHFMDRKIDAVNLISKKLTNEVVFMEDILEGGKNKGKIN